MAHFVKIVKAGAAAHDPRSWTYAIYKCDVCGRESEFTVKGDFQTRERNCKHCGCMDAGDHIKTLQVERENILKQIADLNVKLMMIESELMENKVTLTPSQNGNRTVSANNCSV